MFRCISSERRLAKKKKVLIIPATDLLKFARSCSLKLSNKVETSTGISSSLLKVHNGVLIWIIPAIVRGKLASLHRSVWSFHNTLLAPPQVNKPAICPHRCPLWKGQGNPRERSRTWDITRHAQSIKCNFSMHVLFLWVAKHVKQVQIS